MTLSKYGIAFNSFISISIYYILFFFSQKSLMWQNKTEGTEYSMWQRRGKWELIPMGPTIFNLNTNKGKNEY